MRTLSTTFHCRVVLATLLAFALFAEGCKNRTYHSNLSSTDSKLSADCDMNLTGLAVQDVFRAGKKIETRYLFGMQKNRKDYWQMRVIQDLTYNGTSDDCVKSIRTGSFSSRGTWTAYQYGEDGRVIADCSDVSYKVTAEAEKDFSSPEENLRFFESEDGFPLKKLLLEKDKLEKIELPMRGDFSAETYLLPITQAPYRKTDACPEIATTQNKIRSELTFDYATYDGVHSHLELRGKQTVVPEVGPLPSAVLIGSEVITEKKVYNLVDEILKAGVPEVWVMVNGPFAPGSDRSIDSSAMLGNGDFARLKQMLGERFSRLHFFAGSSTFWTRDWGPLATRTRDGTIRLLQLSAPGARDSENSAPAVLANLMKYDLAKTTDIANDHGNFMVSERGDCAMTDYVIESNYIVDSVSAQEKVGWFYKNIVGCKNIHIFPKMPIDPTGHVDIWGKFLGNGKVMIGIIYDESYRNLWQGFHDQLTSVRNYLNARAEDFSKLGYEVIRVPMAGSTYRHSREGNDALEVRSYVNSLALGKTIIVPKYVEPARPNAFYPDAFAHQLYETHVADAYKRAGFTNVVFLRSDSLIASDGAIHCVTMQIP
jgi:agmatine/peptidylarginine deiminase